MVDRLAEIAGRTAKKTACGCSFRRQNPRRFKILADQGNSAGYEV
jgi:hypothetical protein